MAVEAAVGFALGKLANIMMKERQFLGEVGKKVKLVQIELIRNRYCLRDAADSKHNGDARVHNWLNELCDVAYRIEDAIDTFFLELEDYHKKPSFLHKVKKMWNKPSKMHILNNFGTELDEIQDKLLGISKSRVDFGFIEPQNIVGEDYRFIEWQSIVGDDTEVVEGVNLASYNDMPYYLKACFQYLACFPKEHKIPAKRLIRMWIAEGFIPHDKTNTLEETAKNCLEELVRRSMVQVSSRSISGSIKYCEVHDLLRDLAMQTAGQENFVKVFSRETDVNQPNRGIRRYSLQGSLVLNHRSELYMKYLGPNTHSILMFDYRSLPNFSNFRLLKVLVLENCGRYGDDLQVMGLDGLVYLKFLALIDCNIKCSLHRMKALETLEIRGDTELLDHDALWTIGTLRHVLGNRILYEPPSTIDLRNLQTMKTICLPRTWDGKFPVLNNLRKLGLYNEFDDWVTVTNLLEVLPSLVSLAIHGENFLPMEIVYPKAFPNYLNLQSLSLYGEWPEAVNLEASWLPPHLIKLKLEYPRFKQNPMPELGKLQSLKKLSLLGLCFRYDSPTMCPAGFPVLQNLIVFDQRYENDFTVVEGVMPNLTCVKVPRNFKLHMPPELQNVTINYRYYL